MKTDAPNVYGRLQKLRGQLVEHFLAEADPANWPDADAAPPDGDRLLNKRDAFWHKRNAEATGRLAVRAAQLEAMIGLEGAGAADAAARTAELEASSAWAEKEARRLLRQHEKAEAERLTHKVVDIASGRKAG